MNGNLELTKEWFKKADAMEINSDDTQEAYGMANNVKSFVTEKTPKRHVKHC